MPELGPYIIQSKELTWLKILFDTNSSPTTPRIYLSEFNSSDKGIAEDFQEHLLQPSAFRAYAPSVQRFFVIAFTKKGEIIRLRPAAHDAFMSFQLTDTNKQRPLPTFLELFNGSHWRFVRKPLIKDSLEQSFYNLRDKLMTNNLQSKIDAQYTTSFRKNAWITTREDFTSPIPRTDGELTSIGFYKLLLDIKKLTENSKQYNDALTIVITATNLDDIHQSLLPDFLKEEILTLKRYFYDIKLHPYINSDNGEKSHALSEERFIQMRDAIFREDASLETKSYLSYTASLELRNIFCRAEEPKLDNEEIAKEIFCCRASNFYLESLGLTIRIKSNYIADYYQDDYCKVRKYMQYCQDMLTNQEHLWAAKDMLSVYLLQENDEYNTEIELAKAYHRLQSHINKLIVTAIAKSWSIDRLLNLISNVEELVYAIPRVNPDHTLLNIDNLLKYINNLSELIIVLKHIKDLAKQYQLLRTCPLLSPAEICGNIDNIEQLKSLLAVISPENHKARIYIFNSFPSDALAKLAKSASSLNFILVSFNKDCRNHLLKRNARYCSSLIMNDDDLYLLLDKIHINHLIDIVYYMPLEIKMTLLKDLNALCRVLNLADSNLIANLLGVLPSLTRLQSLHNSTEREKVDFFKSVEQNGLQILFKSLSANEWYTIFPETNHLLNLIEKLEGAKQKLVSCTPSHVKLRIYQEANQHRNRLQTYSRNKFNDFNDLKSLVNQLINPTTIYSYFCFWKKDQKTFPDINNTTQLQILIIDNYLINPAKFNLSSAQRICEEFRVSQMQRDYTDTPKNIKIL